MRLRDLSLLVDQIGDPARVLIFRRFGGAVRQSDLVVGIAQKRKVELVLLRELRVVLLIVEAGAENLDVLGGVVFGEVPEPGTFRRSPRCVGLRKEPQHDFLSAEIPQLHLAALMIGGLKIRGRVTDFQQCWTSSHAPEQMADDSAE
jgi:hypothetical protein